MQDARTLLARVPAAIWILLLLAVGLRVAMWLAYSPAVVNVADSIPYADAAGGELFGDPTRTIGYPIFLRGVHLISDQIELTIAAQHLIGIATALVLYATVRRLGAPVWVGAIGAAAVLLSLDQIFLEHTLMNEALFTLLLVAALYGAVRALDEPRPLLGPVDSRRAWIVGAAGTLALAGSVRAVALPLIALLVLWFVLAIGGSLRARVANGAMAALAGAAVVLGYFSLHAAENGYFGLTEASGWAFYSRVAPFADCSRFDPPPGTRPLCEATAEEARPGPDFYGHDLRSPARQLFGGPPAGNDELAAFARRALLAQPLSYAEDFGRDLIRYFHPSFRPQAFSGVGLEVLDVDRRAPGVEEGIAAALNRYYADDTYEINPGVQTLADVQDVLRVHPKLLLASLLLGGAGLLLARDRLRRGLALLLGASVGIMAIAPATAIWNSRYAVPVSGPMVASGAIGAWLIAAWLRGRWSRRAADR